MDTKKSTKGLETVIADIQVNIAPFRPSQKEQFLEDYHHCPLCGDELLFTHNTHFTLQRVSEEAHCESCHIKVKSHEHSLQ